MEDRNLVEQTVALSDSQRINNDDQEKAKKSTFWSDFTLEPMWFGIYMSLALEIVVLKNLYIQRACLVDLGYSEEVCYMEGSLNATVEIAAQQVVSASSAITGLVSGAITIISVIFLGPWSDASGRRKPLMLLSIGSSVVSSLTTLIVLALPQIPVLWVIYMKTIPMSLGSMTLLELSAFSYLGDVCYKTLRSATVVMGRNAAAMKISSVFGSYIGPIVNTALGFEGIATISFLLQLTSFLYVYLKVKDFNVSEKIPSIVDITLPLKGFKCAFKKREGYKRQIIMTMMLIPTATTFMFANEVAIRYLYLRNAFSWTASDYGIFLSVRQIVNIIGIMMIVKIMKEKLKMRDEWIGIIGAISELCDILIFIFITQSWMLFVICLFGILNGAPMTVERPIINKHIQQDEQGKIYSLISTMEMLIFASYLPFSNYVYSKTLSWFPGCFMLISATGAATQVGCYCAVIYLTKKETLRVQRLAQECPKDA